MKLIISIVLVLSFAVLSQNYYEEQIESINQQEIRIQEQAQQLTENYQRQINEYQREINRLEQQKQSVINAARSQERYGR